jgi:hypothetical protein
MITRVPVRDGDRCSVVSQCDLNPIAIFRAVQFEMPKAGPRFRLGDSGRARNLSVIEGEDLKVTIDHLQQSRILALLLLLPRVRQPRIELFRLHV